LTVWNVLVADAGNGRVAKLDLADPPSLTLPARLWLNQHRQPQTVTVENIEMRR